MAARGQTDRKAMGLLPPTFQVLLFDYLPPNYAITGYTTEVALCGYKLTANLMPTVSWQFSQIYGTEKLQSY